MVGWFSGSFNYEIWFVNSDVSRFESDCSKRFYRWPDGNLIDYGEIAPLYGDPSNTPRISREQELWLDKAQTEIGNCVAAMPIKSATERLSLRATNIWSVLQGSIPFMLLPPFVLLIAGSFFGWILNGFRENP